MTEPIFKIHTEDALIDKRLSEDEIKQALKELERLSLLEVPAADWTVEPIKRTNKEWYRQKLPGENWRNILVFKINDKTITLKAILLRDNNTYRIARKLYLAEEDE
jgi:hypothetical protein